MKPRARHPKRPDPAPTKRDQPPSEIVGLHLHDAITVEGLVRVLEHRAHRDGMPVPNTPEGWADELARVFGSSIITGVSVSSKRRTAQLTTRGNRGAQTLHVPLRYLKPAVS